MSTLPNMILPAAAPDRYQSEASTVFSGHAGEGGEQFDHLMARALLNPSGTNNLTSDSAGSKFPAPLSYPFAADNSGTASLISRNSTPITPILSTTAKDSDKPLDNSASESLLASGNKSLSASPNSTSPGRVDADDSPVDSKNPESATIIPAAPAINVSTVANANFVSSAPTPGVLNQPGAANGPVNRLAAPITSPATGNKNISISPYSNRGQVAANHSPVLATGLKPGTAVSSAAPANTLPVANNDSLSDSPANEKIAAINNQAGNTGEQLATLINAAPLTPATIKNPITSQNPAPVKTSAGTVPLHSKDSRDSKAVAQTSDTSHDNDISAPDAARPAANPPPISDPTVNPINITAQILAPVAAVSGLSVKTAATPPSGRPSTSGQTASPLPVLPVTDTPTTSSAKITSQVAPPSQPMPEADPKVQTDSVKKDPAYAGIEAYAKNNFTDANAKTAVLTPAASPISSAAKEPITQSVNTSDPAIKTTDDSQSTGLPPLDSTDAKISAPLPSLMNGTPTAQQDELMNSGGKTTKTTDLTGKFLPGSVSVVARGNDLPGRADQFSATAAAGISASGNPLTATATATASATDSVESFTTDDARAQTLERTHDLVAVHAMNVGNTETDSSLQVIIRPGAGTQLSLELRQHAGGVEAQAALQHGDFNHLSQHWPELQQRLEQRGIRLAPLTDNGSFAGNSGGETFNQKQNQTGEATADMVPAASVTGTFAQPTARAKAPTGWETWA